MNAIARIVRSSLLLAAIGWLAGCGGSKQTLHLYTWQDYLDPELVAAFEKANNCRVMIDTFDSNESMYAKVQAGSSGYDVIFPSSYQVALMAKNNHIQKLDKSRLPNVVKHFDKTYAPLMIDPEMTYNVPYAITFTGLAYRKDKIEDTPIDSWDCLKDDRFNGRISLLNDMRETIGAALKKLGYSVNSVNEAELDKALALVLEWKKHIAKFDNEQYKTGVAGGEFIIGHGYNGDVSQVMADAPDKIGFSLPKEGFTAACDEMVIPTTAQNVDLAYAFINFMYEPANAAKNIEYICTVMPNKEGIALLPEEVRGSPSIILPPDRLKDAEVIRDLGDKNILFTKIWDKIKSTE